jgi:hypothetical protein
MVSVCLHQLKNINCHRRKGNTDRAGNTLMRDQFATMRYELDPSDIETFFAAAGETRVIPEETYDWGSNPESYPADSITLGMGFWSSYEAHNGDLVFLVAGALFSRDGNNKDVLVGPRYADYQENIALADTQPFANFADAAAMYEWIFLTVQNFVVENDRTDNNRLHQPHNTARTLLMGRGVMNTFVALLVEAWEGITWCHRNELFLHTEEVAKGRRAGVKKWTELCDLTERIYWLKKQKVDVNKVLDPDWYTDDLCIPSLCHSTDAQGMEDAVQFFVIFRLMLYLRGVEEAAGQ